MDNYFTKLKNKLTGNDQESILCNQHKYVRFIGKGSFGIVIETEKLNGKKRAIKLINGSDSSIGREIDALTEESIDYKYIVKYYRSWNEKTSILQKRWRTLYNVLRITDFPESIAALEFELCQGQYPRIKLNNILTIQ